MTGHHSASPVGPSVQGGPGAAFLGFGADGNLTKLPALDGLRGLAVLAVVLFHADFGWAKGGFLGVSLFFTLSGYLITSLLIAERTRSSSINLKAFWARRFRRLLPAAWCTLAAIAIIQILLNQYGAAQRLDLLASFGQVANWRFLATGSSYNQLFSQPSPVRHFWSLAIEEQAYLVIPFLCAAALRFKRAPVAALGVALGVIWLLSALSTLVWSSAERIYYATDTRASELCIGAILATVVAQPGFRKRVVRHLWSRWFLQFAALAATVGTVWAWGTVEVTDPRVSGGGLLVMGVVSSTLVLGASLGVGVLGRALSWGPLRYLGRISYGIYLFHWPALVFLTERRTGIERAPRLVLIGLLVLMVAHLSHRFIESPILRGGSPFRGIKVQILGPAMAVGLLAVALVGGSNTDARRDSFDAEVAGEALERLQSEAASTQAASSQTAGSQAASSVAPTTQPATAPGESVLTSTTLPVLPNTAPPRFSVYGDSIALSFAFPLAQWAHDSATSVSVGGDSVLGCGIGRGGSQRAFGEKRREARCENWAERWSSTLDTHDPDIAIVQSSQWELVDRQLAGEQEWRTLGDPIYEQYLLQEFLDAHDLLASRGALVLWVTVPEFSRLDAERIPKAMDESHDPERVARLNEIIHQVVKERPQTARMVDLATWMASRINDTQLREDGAHFNLGATEVAESFLGPQMLEYWRAWNATGGE